MVFNVFKELSVDRVNDVRGVWEVARVAVPNFIASGIDLEIALPQLSVLVPIPWSYGSGDNGSLSRACAAVDPPSHRAKGTINSAAFGNSERNNDFM